ncbi:hypothetical protein DL96DRAFT_1608361 [Flagelloscypha sp. PMI_526]|nr:hypothetical protein DL96DRAFT_1608361 [Flagelloscypha sp. PMI_526]
MDNKLGLPYDILSIVFGLCISQAEPYRQPQRRLCEDIHYLSLVCRLWRSIILSNPGLWTDLGVVIEVDQPNLLAWLELCLERSGTALLNIDLFFARGVEPDSHPETVDAVLLGLLSHSSRWRTFKLWHPYNSSDITIPDCLDDPTRWNFSSLTELRIESLARLPKCFAYLPALNTLSLQEHCIIDVNQTTYPLLRIFRSVAGSTLDDAPRTESISRMQYSDVATRIDAYPLLEELAMTSTMRITSRTRHPRTITNSAHLHRLQLFESVRPLQYLDLPSLIHLELHTSIWIDRAPTGLDEPFFPDFISRCTSLQTLIISPTNTLAWLTQGQWSQCPLETLTIRFHIYPCTFPTTSQEHPGRFPSLKEVNLLVEQDINQTWPTETVATLSGHLSNPSCAFPPSTVFIVKAQVFGTKQQVDSWRDSFMRTQKVVGENRMKLEISGYIDGENVRNVADEAW